MDTPLWPLTRFVLLIAGLLGPGAMITAALRVPPSLGFHLAASCVAVYTTVLAFTATGVPVNLGTLTAGLAAITAVAAVAAWARQRRPHAAPAPATEIATGTAVFFAPFTRMGRWTPLYAVFWAVVIVRAVREPLAGPDVGFRWSFLAEQLLRTGSLNFYPPISPPDFTRYFWVESIPPGIAAMYAWVYACAGVAGPAWTVPAVVLQVWAVHDLLWNTASRIGGERAARFTVLAAAVTPLLTWSMLLGQETGYTALAIAGIACSVVAWSRNPEPRWAAIAGVFSVLGASAREYGLVFPAIAAAGLLLARPEPASPQRARGRVGWIVFALLAAPLSLAWPLWVWSRTGNPFYSLPLGWFPTNTLFVSWVEHCASVFGTSLQTGEGWLAVFRYFTHYAPAAAIGWLVLAIGAGRGRRVPVLGLAGVVVMLGLWLASVRYTSGGLFYAMRVTSPALVLGALAGGCALASMRTVTAPAAVLLALFMGTLPSMMALPANPWRTPWRDWPGIVGGIPVTPDPIVEAVLSRPDTKVVIADAPGFQTWLAPAGISVIPLWSPQATWLISDEMPAAEAVRRWRESGLRYLIATKNPVNETYFAAHAWFRSPFRVRKVAETEVRILLEIDAGD